MDPLLIIGVCVFLYFSLRKHGNLKFKLKDEHKWIAISYVEELLKKAEPHKGKISYSDFDETDAEIGKCYDLQNSIAYKMKDFLSEKLTNTSFSRNKIHDLESEILNIIHERFNYSDQSLYLALFSITGISFKKLIESYDFRKKNW